MWGKAKKSNKSLDELGEEKSEERQSTSGGK